MWHKEDNVGFHAALRSKQNRQGREILREVMDLRENSETKGVMVSSRSRSRHGGNERKM